MDIPFHIANIRETFLGKEDNKPETYQETFLDIFNLKQFNKPFQVKKIINMKYLFHSPILSENYF